MFHKYVRTLISLNIEMIFHLLNYQVQLLLQENLLMAVRNHPILHLKIIIVGFSYNNKFVFITLKIKLTHKKV